MADIFISYARSDRDRIEKLAAALEGEGYSVWWDRNIVGGAEYSKDIEAALEAAKVVIVAWSQASIDSTWVKDEALTARDQGKLAPVTIDGTLAPIGFKQFHLIDLESWKGKADSDGFQDLTRTITARLTGETPAVQAASAESVVTRASQTVHKLPSGVLIVLIIAIAVASIAIFGDRTPPTRSPSIEEPRESDESLATNTNIHPEELSQGENVTKDGDKAQPPEKSIAVLPFADMSAAGDQAYFADGIAEEILNLLAKSSELKVAGRTSSFQFKGRNEDLRIIGEVLGVATILEGSLRKSGERVRITAQLIRTSDGYHLWSDTYDGDLTDIFALQEEIATAIAAELRAPLGLDAGALADARTKNLEAYQHYLAGMAQYASRGEAVIEAIENFRAAVALDPEFAAAWAGLANAYYVLPGWVSDYKGAPIDQLVIYSEARYATLRAQDLHSNLPQTLNALTNMHQIDHQWESSEKAISRAYELAPNSAAILEDYYEMMQFTGQWEKGLPIAEHLVEVDPLKPFNWINLGWARWDMRDHIGAAAAFEKSLELDNPLEVGAHEYVALLLSQGDADAAALVVANNDWISAGTRDCFNSVIARYSTPRSPAPPCDRYASAGSSAGETAEFSLILYGEKGVLSFLEQNVRNQSGGHLNVNSEAIASVRDSARYKKLIRDAGFERYWRNNGWPSHCRPLGDNDFECTSGTYSDG